MATPVTITFNANGGSGTVPSAISTYAGVANTIPSNSLTRTGYTFNGWNTASDGSGTSYATGSTITPTASVTLYAQWKTTYVAPDIQNLVAFRVANTSGGASPTVTSIGTTGFCKFQLVGGANYTFTKAWVRFTPDTWYSMTKSGTTIYGYSGAGKIAQASAYSVEVEVTVTGTDGRQRTYYYLTYISKSVPVFDISNDANCFAFFGTATDGLAGKRLIVNGETMLNPALPIASGGTDATTAWEARDNLEVKKYTTKEFTLSNQSVSANTYKSLTFSITLFGYNPIGIISISHGTYELAIVSFLTYSTEALVVLRNVTGSAKTADVTIKVLYEEA